MLIARTAKNYKLKRTDTANQAFSEWVLSIEENMNKKKITLAILLFALGNAGIASLLTMEIPLPPEAEELLKKTYTDGQIKLLVVYST